MPSETHCAKQKQLHLFHLDWIGNLGVDAAHILATSQAEVAILAPIGPPAILDDPRVLGVANEENGVVDSSGTLGCIHHTTFVVLRHWFRVHRNVQWAVVDQRLLDVLVR